MDIGKWKILAVSMVLICSLTMSVFAIYIYRTPGYQLSTGIVLNGPTMQLGIYWDLACTQPATYIDFGEMVVSSVETTLARNIFIRNEGTYVHTVFWNSTLAATTTAITDEWIYVDYSMFIPLNMTDFDVDQVLNSTYKIHIEGGPPAGTYNWTLTVWGESTV